MRRWHNWRFSFYRCYYYMAIISTLATFFLFYRKLFYEDNLWQAYSNSNPSTIRSTDFHEQVKIKTAFWAQHQQLISRRKTKDMHIAPFIESLPHLMQSQSLNINPTVFVPQNANQHRTPPDLVISIPTTRRMTKNYIYDTIKNLVSNLADCERWRVLFLIFIAEEKTEIQEKYAVEIARYLNEQYPLLLEEGLFEVIGPPPYFYPPDLNSVVPTFNDSTERMIWRTKQNLDYSYIMSYSQTVHSRSSYYLQLEDDVVTVPGYVSKILSFAFERKFFTCDFSNLGFIAKLFKIPDLHLFVAFDLLFYRYKPVDWLLEQFYSTRYCNPEEKNCVKNRINNHHRFYYNPPLFQHVGRYSSLKGKIQPLREKTFRSSPTQLSEVCRQKEVETQLSTNIVGLTTSTLNKLLQFGTPVRIENPPDGSFIKINYGNKPLVVTEIDIRYAYKVIEPTVESISPLSVELQSDSETWTVNSTIAEYFNFATEEKSSILEIRVLVSNEFRFDYFTFTSLRIV
ncbi:hypothetical protein M3Y96_00839100 [Aphelenchoides besseyi]|nr:hypothetical protein M3Y96_00839100 [Aphelenchoides besseyi]